LARSFASVDPKSATDAINFSGLGAPLLDY
jgi:hypothetical protein